ncbi:WW domain-binding protein 2-like [Corticium candelabrum]|uniref:WW domain-binding protein 2-like n=1 Tax=Corticium candelabrum TaxID=121492 RepID=UPI002E367468|nr:WW domain-binding protein 2-like [Corticium candelabrum]
MALNVAWNNGQLCLATNENILTSYKNVELKLSGGSLRSMKAMGEVHLSQYRIVFVSSKNSEMTSFSMPFQLLRQIEIKQPLFGANYLQGEVTAEADGGWQGRADFSLTFSEGGAIDFSSLLLRKMGEARQSRHVMYTTPSAPPPSYTPPSAPPADFSGAKSDIPTPAFYYPQNSYPPYGHTPSAPSAPSMPVPDDPPPYEEVVRNESK